MTIAPQTKLVAQQRVQRERVGDRSGIGDAGRLDDDALERRHASAGAAHEEVPQRFPQAALEPAAQAPRIQQQHVVLAALDEEVIEADLAELVHDDRGVRERRPPQKQVQQRRLAAAEKPGEHRHRDATAAGYAGTIADAP